MTNEANDFNPDWDAMAVMVEEQQRMAKRIQELESVGAQLVEALESLLNDVGRANSMLGAVKARAALAAAKEAGYERS